MISFLILFLSVAPTPSETENCKYFKNLEVIKPVINSPKQKNIVYKKIPYII